MANGYKINCYFVFALFLAIKNLRIYESKLLQKRTMIYFEVV